MKYGMLIDYGNCTNCGTCTIACRKEKGLPLEEWGITVNEIGPKKLGGKWEWDYVPVPSRLCDLCVGRRAAGKLPSCQHHCLAKVIEVLPLEEIPARMAEIGTKVTCYLP